MSVPAGGVRAVILAAGQGTRLRPLTDDRPKCMVELDGIPLLHRQLAALHRVGITDVTIVTGYLRESVVAPGARLVTNPAYARTNMVASLFCAEDVLTSGADVLISYGDIVCEPWVLAAARSVPGALAVVVDLGWRAYWQERFDDPLTDAETLRFGRGGTIIELGGRPCSLEEIQGQYIGLIRVSADAACGVAEAYGRVREQDPERAAAMYMTEFLQMLIDQGQRVMAVPVTHGWLEIDSPTDLTAYEDGRLRRFYDGAAALPPSSGFSPSSTWRRPSTATICR